MVSVPRRLALLVATVVVLVVAFVVARPDDDDETRSPARQVTTNQASPLRADSRTTAERPKAPRPRYAQVRVKDGQPVGGVKTIEVDKGKTARIAVRSDVSEEAHLHGYDISKPVGPGRRARFRFEAKLDGIFELELEHAGVQIAELRVNP